jgi:hypothetical protein
VTLPGRDLFEFWRLVLGSICTIYALVIAARSLWGWLVYFSGMDRSVSMARQYLVVQLLRLRIRRFSGELLRIALWTGVLIYLLRLHIE